MSLVAALCMSGGIVAAQSVSTPPASPARPDSLPALYDQVSPSVVSIATISINPYDPDQRVDRAMGSGVIIDASGLVLTNSHVVLGRQAITVTLDDGTALPAKFVGADPVFDIGLIKIPVPSQGSLPVATLGDSTKLRVGEEVYAIGNPLGLDQTLTRGIVSALNRMLPGAMMSLTEPLIQTDAAINPGNSGGPLVDGGGRVIGITTAILSEAQSIGFAVPTNLIRAVIPELIEKGRIVRPWLGVQGQFVAPALKQLLRIPLVDGLLVEAVETGSPADQQGLRGGMFELTIEGQPVLLGGDIITHINGVAMDDPRKLAQTLDHLKVGSELKLTVNREGKVVMVDLTLVERPLLPWDISGGRRTAGGLTGTTARIPGARARTFVF